MVSEKPEELPASLHRVGDVMVEQLNPFINCVPSILRHIIRRDIPRVAAVDDFVYEYPLG